MKHAFVLTTDTSLGQYFYPEVPVEVVGCVGNSYSKQYLVKKQRNLQNTYWAANVSGKIEDIRYSVNLKWESYSGLPLESYKRPENINYIWLTEKDLKFILSNKEMKQTLVKLEEY
jgi:hypothetical protein